VSGQILRYRDLPLDRLPVFVRAGTVVPHTRAHNRAQDWQGDIDITELAVCGEPDFGYGVTQYFLRKDGAGGWRTAGKVGLVKRIGYAGGLSLSTKKMSRYAVYTDAMITGPSSSQPSPRGIVATMASPKITRL
jgi:hypothetical protein